jgi:hypothetical protein
MKRLITIFLSIALTVPLLAASARQSKPGSESNPRLLASQPGRLARIIAAYKADRSGPRASAVADVRSTRLLLFPAAGNVRGSNGELFRSDVTLVSFNQTVPQKVVAIWLQNGVTTDDPPFLEMTLAPNTYYTYKDFVGVTLQRLNQLGSILVVPVDGAGNVDFDGAALDGFSRIWTNQPNATGTVAQPFEPVDPYSMYAFETATILGLRHDSQYRSNYGIVNIDDVPHTFTVRFLGEQAQNNLTVTVPANSMIHQAIPSGAYGSLVIEIDVDDPVAPWFAYGTSNDNVTGDGWVSMSGGLFTPEDLDDIDGGF